MGVFAEAVGQPDRPGGVAPDVLELIEARNVEAGDQLVVHPLAFPVPARAAVEREVVGEVEREAPVAAEAEQPLGVLAMADSERAQVAQIDVGLHVDLLGQHPAAEVPADRRPFTGVSPASFTS